ncbi:hypothetical protein BDV41DRAFT_548994 [Aspergillus transmontanensis]|uniref:Uncharacterized protein n=1 Tax=Aspergillus transmontanensis TaxID=1034304 RepID=A0A5N6VPU1_9EURO|nr:hypothetical protein BDV41DRAFT_548994 [Aspergillus transmontanensis]
MHYAYRIALRTSSSCIDGSILEVAHRTRDGNTALFLAEPTVCFTVVSFSNFGRLLWHLLSLPEHYI